jgi:formiminoglutamate deiminase
VTEPRIYHSDLAVIEGVVRERVTIVVDDGRFGAITCDDHPPAASVRLRGLTMPSMANAHSHAFHRALRGRVQTGGGSFWTWREVMYAAVERLDPDSYFRLARATFAEMALAGYGVVGEFHYLHHPPDGGRYADPNAMGAALLAAADEAGIRITLLDTLYLHGGIGRDASYRSPEGAQVRFGDGSVDAWMERVEVLVSSTTQRIGAAVHSVRAVDRPAVRQVAVWAAGREAPLHTHVSEQPAENEECLAAHGLTPTGVLNEAGAVGRDFTAVHATHVTDRDIGILGSARATACFCPTTERDLGDGIGPSRALAEAGAAIALGSDSQAVIDPFEETRALELNDRLDSGERGRHPTQRLVAMATLAGHRSLGWDDAGMIATGCRADLVTVSLDSVRTAGASPDVALETALFAATAADVRDVIVDGVPIVAEGRHLRLDVAGELARSIGELYL